MKDLEERYTKLIDACANERRNLEIPNGSPLHAKYLLKKFFDVGGLSDNTQINILTGELFDKVFDSEMSSAANVFLSKSGNNLEIAFTDYNSKEAILKGEFMRNLISCKERKGTIILYDASHAKEINHFAIMDDHAYRLEIDHEKKIAVANFGDSDKVKRLIKVFEVVKQGAKPVELSEHLA